MRPSCAVHREQQSDALQLRCAPSDAREVKHVNMRRHVVEYRIVHGTPVPVAGTPGRDVPLFRSQKASVEHAIANQRSRQSRVRPRLPTAFEPEPQRMCSVMRRDQVFLLAGRGMGVVDGWRTRCWNCAPLGLSSQMASDKADKQLAAD